MTITVDQIKALREETGAGIMDVRKALSESNGNVEAAREWIKQKGLSRAASKADRETGVSYIFSYVHFNGSVGAMVKLACETDFVAKCEDFQKLGKEVSMQAASMRPETVEELLKQPYLRDAKVSIEELLKQVAGKTGENIRILQISVL